MQIDIATDISTTGMQLLWTVPMSTMLLESLQTFFCRCC
jgi:two-component system sensor histidine kinase RcsD